MCLGLCIFSALLLGILHLFFGAFPLVFGTNHGFDLWQTGLTFLGIMVAMLLGVASNPLWHRIRANLIRRHERETGVKGGSESEFRLPPAIFGSMLVPTGLFMFGWSTYPWVRWIVPIIDWVGHIWNRVSRVHPPRCTAWLSKTACAVQEARECE